MKRKSAFLLALVMTACALCSCGNSIDGIKKSNNDNNTSGTEQATTTTVPETTTTTTTTTTLPPVQLPEISTPSVWSEGIVISGSGENIRAIMPYYGTYEYGEQYSNIINQFRSKVETGVNVYNMCLPTSAGFYIPDDCKDVFSDQKDNIDNINGLLGDGVVPVDCWTALARHVDEYIYSRTDHHWQPLGAYYAAQAFANSAGIDFLGLEDYDSKTLDNFAGTMNYFSGYYSELGQYPDTFKYYIPKNKFTTTYYNTDFTNPVDGTLLWTDYSGENCYMTFQGGDEKITEIKTDCTNDRTLVIVKDSYGNALSPFLTSSFSKIYVCDFRYFTTGFLTFLKDVNCTDLLFAITLSACQTPDLQTQLAALIGE